jgi:hypothetical protein
MNSVHCNFAGGNKGTDDNIGKCIRQNWTQQITAIWTCVGQVLDNWNCGKISVLWWLYSNGLLSNSETAQCWETHHRVQLTDRCSDGRRGRLNGCCWRLWSGDWQGGCFRNRCIDKGTNPVNSGHSTPPLFCEIHYHYLIHVLAMCGSSSHHHDRRFLNCLLLIVEASGQW